MTAYSAALPLIGGGSGPRERESKSKVKRSKVKRMAVADDKHKHKHMCDKQTNKQTGPVGELLSTCNKNLGTPVVGSDVHALGYRVQAKCVSIRFMFVACACRATRNTTNTRNFTGRDVQTDVLYLYCTEQRWKWKWKWSKVHVVLRLF